MNFCGGKGFESGLVAQKKNFVRRSIQFAYSQQKMIIRKKKKIIVICRNLMETRVSSYPGITRRLLEDFKPKLDSLVLGSPKCYEYPLENTLNFEYSLGFTRVTS